MNGTEHYQGVELGVCWRLTRLDCRFNWSRYHQLYVMWILL